MTAGLEYQCQSGALNESMSDIFASNVDTDDWEIGEDLPGGAIRDMDNPANGDPPQPAHVDDFNEMPNDGNPFNDHGGVHYNSGIPNHAYYLMVQAIGRDRAEQIVYRALTEKLEPTPASRTSAPPRSRSRASCGARTAPSTGARRVLRGGRPRRDLGSSRGGGMLMRTMILAGLALVLLAGCGADDERAAAASRPPSSPAR